ncbi:type IV pilus biogenesis/stability protein PilW [Alkalimonas collagenimarina]|uniref:Type IV pilus biogenesis/stability protein PilW n=1 Tax=Alkalimonas collagenimarina TaxID=400390 RepID=A0ABT9H322_9GAMM|nr:type IV pilus biogenesis/stability protein PilW [Alkalimonas collagenimarina]MDP4537701.1 type IV pilus biogenesis/stability protein PilW [Alkalimonas collagenimarina]
MQKLSVSIVVMSAFVLSGCVSESTYVGSDRPVQQRQVDNTEAARTRMSLGLNYLQRGENAQAIYNLERARVMAPQLPEVYNALAYYYQSVGENEQAESAYKQSLARDADNADTYNNYGAFLCQIDKYEEAERLLLNAIRRPGYMRVSESYENLALCMLQQNSFGRAHQYLEASVVHSSNRISSLLNLAALEYAMGNNQAARQHLTRIQRLGHVSANTSLLSYLIADKELNEEAMKASRELLLQVYPDSEPAQLMLQHKLDQTEYEQLRERYKQYLISQIDLPAESEPAQSNTSSSQPQIRIVRKTSSADPQTATRSESLARPSQPSVATAAEATTAPVRPEPAHEATDIAASLAMFSPVQTAPRQPSVSSTSGNTPSDQHLTAETKTTEAPKPQYSSSEQPSRSAEQLDAARSEESFSEQAALVELQTDAVVHDSSPQTDRYDSETESMHLADVESTEAELPTAMDAEAVSRTEFSEVVSQRQSVPQHIVQQGESLFSISVQYNIRLERLQQWNNLTPEAVIRSGQRLWLAEAPAELLNEPEIAAIERPDFHVVARGDTLFSISMLYNVRLSRLLYWNNLTDQSRVYVGQQIYLSDPATINHDD